MKKLFSAGLFALLFAATATPAPAQFGCPSCVGLFSKIHQHGPLYNYGPYYGYYPFEPYGPWGSDLSYHGGNCGGNCGRPGLNLHLNLHLPQRNGCHTCGTTWGHYAKSTLTNVFHRVHPLAHRAGCSTCATASTGGDCDRAATIGSAVPVLTAPAPLESAAPGVSHVGTPASVTIR